MAGVFITRGAKAHDLVFGSLAIDADAEVIMTGSTGDKAKGKINEAIGRGKRGLGEASEDRELRREGQEQQYRGEGQQAKGEVKEKVKKAVDKF